MHRELCERRTMNELTGLSQALQEGGGPGLLAEYGIAVEGSPEALATLRRLLVGKPIGQALVLIAQFGRQYGIRLFTTSQFDEHLFLKDAARFGMDYEEATMFALNLIPQPGAVPKLSSEIRPLHLGTTRKKRPPRQ
ncbi:hypothetical protein ACKU27_04235 [Sphingobium yanoikuyae]|uniref:hypothetical protein n=1 Tax=Sphingobium yanoikuyae TaxID=13690 RepID=UPI003B910764